MLYTLPPNALIADTLSQPSGRQGLILNLSYSAFIPKIYSVMQRYSHPALPVIHENSA